MQDVIGEVGDTSEAKIDQVVSSLPAGFPEQMAASISQAAKRPNFISLKGVDGPAGRASLELSAGGPMGPSGIG